MSSRNRGISASPTPQSPPPQEQSPEKEKIYQKQWKWMVYRRHPLRFLLLTSILLLSSFAITHRFGVLTKFKALSAHKKLAEKTSPVRRIPRTLWFTYSHDILQEKRPKHYFENVRHTIQVYRDSWQNKTHQTPIMGLHENKNSTEEFSGEYDDESIGFQVKFLTDETCQAYVDRAEPRLLKHFLAEPRGPFKSDICRVAALYLQGGYYFDVDMEVIQPVPLEKEQGDEDNNNNNNNNNSGITFATSKDAIFGYFFQSFLAAAPRGPILKRALDVMLEYYEHKARHACNIPTQVIMGTCTLKLAYDGYMAKTERHNVTKIARGEDMKRKKDTHVEQMEHVLLLQETGLEPKLYPDLKRRNGVEGSGSCDYIVHDPVLQVPYFYSRIVGSAHCQRIKPREKQGK